MALILASKILPPFQKKHLLKAGFQVVEHDFIKIEATSFKMPKEIKNAIFTSQNAVVQIKSYELRVKSCFCVGEKTKKLLEEKGMNVIASAGYGKDLAEIIIKKHPNEYFTFFCGNRRRDELPSILKKNQVSFEEIEVYKTILNSRKIEQKLDGILFFSPSGVESFCLENSLKNATAFCIGTTTAKEAEKYTSKIITAKNTTIESLVDQVVTMKNTLT